MIHKVLFAGEISWIVLCLVGFADAAGTNASIRVAFTNASVIAVLDHYEHTLHRAIQVAAPLPKAQITLRSTTPLTPDEYMKTVRTVLQFHGLTIETNVLGEDVIQVWTNAPEGLVESRTLQLLPK